MVRRKSPVPNATRDEEWVTAIKKNKLFLYRKGELMPTYTFVKRDGTRYWEGHGCVHQSVPEAIAWAKSKKGVL